MTTKNWLLGGFAVFLAGTYVIFFTDWLRPTPIEVLAEIRAAGPRRGGQPAGNVYPVSFALDGRYQLTSLKVIKTGTTNVLWPLVSGTNAAPVKAIIYGRPVPGMKPVGGNGRAQPLEPDVVYELQVSAGRYRGEATFQTKEIVAPAETGN